MASFKPQPWQLKMLDRSLKKRQKLYALYAHVHCKPDSLCLLVTCGDNNGAMNYRIREWGGSWNWADLEGTHVSEMEHLLLQPVTRIDPVSCHIPFPDESFDCVLTIDCHEHLRDPSLLNKELCRITKPGAKVVVTVPNGDASKPAVRLKRCLGMTEKEYGHVVIGYQIPELRALLKTAGLQPVSSSSYSRFFTELIELGINYIYVKLLRKHGSSPAGTVSIAPITKDQIGSVTKTLRIYSIVFPVLKAISQLDRLLAFTTGYAVIVETRKA